jgi:hypothetical protein
MCVACYIDTHMNKYTALLPLVNNLQLMRVFMHYLDGVQDVDPKFVYIFEGFASAAGPLGS